MSTNLFMYFHLSFAFGPFPATRNVLSHVASVFFFILLQRTEFVCLCRTFLSNYYGRIFSATLLFGKRLQACSMEGPMYHTLSGHLIITGFSFSFHFSRSMLMFCLEMEWGLGVALTMALLSDHFTFVKRCVVYLTIYTPSFCLATAFVLSFLFARQRSSWVSHLSE